MKILGISCFYHDSAACLLDGDHIVAAAQEERFTRKKHDAAFPSQAVRYCLAEGGIGPEGPDAVAFYDKPILKLHRIMETFLSVAPSGVAPYLRAMPVWLRDKLWIEPKIKEALTQIGIQTPEKIYYPEHHESHAAAAFYPSPFQEAAVVTMDGVGEWTTTSIAVGEGRRLKILKELRFPHSLGLLYSAFTHFTGFRVNSGEYKLMGLAPYGEPRYADLIREKLIHIQDDGSFRLDMSYFGYLNQLTMTNEKFAKLFGGPARKPESPLTVREMDLARSIQEVTEELVLKIARQARELTGKENLCLAGGVALNCVANGALLRSNIFKKLWIQPAAGDAGGALGAAYITRHEALGQERQTGGGDLMQGGYLGPQFEDDEIREYLDAHNCAYRELKDEEWADHLAGLIAEGRVLGLSQGRMEFGPRALGNRSIVGDPRSPEMQSVMNLKIKYRESFRPFAPACLQSEVSQYFEMEEASPYMLLVANVQKKHMLPTKPWDKLHIQDQANTPRSTIPAVTHVDGSARIQTVSQETNPKFHSLLKAFQRQTGCPLVINTSFNVRGEPIVCTPEDAYRCFMRTEMDYLALGSFLLKKEDQPNWNEKGQWRDEFQLD